MEDQRQYCLKWNNHPTNISSVFDRLRSEELFVDVTLASQDRQVSCDSEKRFIDSIHYLTVLLILFFFTKNDMVFTIKNVKVVTLSK